jgi:LuxR family maltose regulon positive regulatory protein
LLEARLHHPPPRDSWIARDRLLDALDRAAALPVCLVAAPAGYGKTTLVAQWLASGRAPAAAWVALDAGDDDPRRLWTHVARALEQAGCLVDDDLDGFLAEGGHDIPGIVLPRLVNALAATPEDVAILLDDFHCLRDPDCHDQVALLVDNLPERAHLVIITRADPGLRLGRLRASGRLAEIRADDLGFRADEAVALLASGDVHLSRDGIAVLMERTEGWPAGLYLAALSLAGRDDPDSLVYEFKGGNRFVGDYLTEEVLSRHPDDAREFITSMSILDRFTAPLCDAVWGRPGSAALLHDLERANMFLIPLDEGRRWYRFHHLFAAVARAELEVEHPDLVPVLHSRAAAWFRQHDFVDEAVAHAMAAGSAGDVAALVQANWLDYVDVGRAGTVLAWVESLGEVGEDDPAGRVIAAWMAALTGDAGALAEHLSALQEWRDVGPLPDGTTSVAAAIALIQGLFGFGGPEEMTTGAELAVALETDGRSPYHAIAHLGRGHAAYIAGDLELAGLHLVTAAQSETAPGLVRVLSLSAHSLVERERGRPGRSRDLAELAMDIVRRRGMERLPQAASAFTALGLAQAEDGDVHRGLATLADGLAARRQNPDVGPWGIIHLLLAMARVSHAAGHTEAARELLAECAERMDRFDAGMDRMWERHDAVAELLGDRYADGEPTGGPDRVSLEPLTDRETDVLRLLQGPLTVGEISAELYLSTNTVKTHARAVYRKLGVHSRTEAVAVARRRRLI